MRFLDKHVCGGGKGCTVVGCEQEKKRKGKERGGWGGEWSNERSGIATNDVMIDLICSMCDLW